MTFLWTSLTTRSPRPNNLIRNCHYPPFFYACLYIRRLCLCTCNNQINLAFWRLWCWWAHHQFCILAPTHKHGHFSTKFTIMTNPKSLWCYLKDRKKASMSKRWQNWAKQWQALKQWLYQLHQSSKITKTRGFLKTPTNYQVTLCFINLIYIKIDQHARE